MSAAARTEPVRRTMIVALLGCAALFDRTGARAASPGRGQRIACTAGASSLTPPTWRSTAPPAPADARRGPLRVVRDVPLPGPARRFDYQSVDPDARRLYVSHMGGDHLVVVDIDSAKVVAYVAGIARPTGVWAVPTQHAVYVSAPGSHEVVAVDDRTLRITARVGGISFPDGIAYAPAERTVFVSDESGAADVAIDAAKFQKRATIALGGEAGNTHYDSVSHCVLVAVQTRNQLVAIDPATDRIVRRYDLPGADHPHGFALDEVGRLAFVTSEESGVLQVLDLRTMRVVATERVGDDPDVLAWDASWRRLYVASESGTVSEFVVGAATLRRLAEVRAPHAHSVAVDPRTHRVYLPLENLGGRPVLRVLEPTP